MYSPSPLNERVARIYMQIALEKCFFSVKGFPTYFITDSGLEFNNSNVKELYSLRHIKHVRTNSLLKAAMVERFSRTLKNRIFKYMAHAKTKKWIDVLSQIVLGINNSINRSIGWTPQEVLDGVKIPMDLPVRRGVDRRPRFVIGDRVRLSKARKVFRKGYLSGYTETVFIITEVRPSYFADDPVTYRAMNSDTGQVLPGIVYRHEMVQAVNR